VPAAQGQPAKAGSGYNPADSRQAKGIGGMVYIALGATALDSGGARLRINPNALHAGEINNQAVIA
jgi:hypothetical protein